MKYKLIGIGMTAAILLAVFLSQPAEYVEERGRVHQHLSYRRDMGCDCDGEQLCSHLPLVVIDTGGQKIPGEVTGNRDLFGQNTYTTAEDGSKTINVKLAVIDNKDRNNHPDDTPDFSTPSLIHIRGKSSRRFAKPSYALRFVDEQGLDSDYAVMGMDPHHEWVLHGPIMDKSLIRNYMWYNISGEVMDYAPNVRFCEVILDGEYQGLYLMVENITDGSDSRLHLSMHTKNAKGTGYLLRIDRPTQQDLGTDKDIYAYNERMFHISSDISIRYPGAANLTPELAKDIELDYSAFEKALFSFDYDNEKYGYWNWIDVNNFATYYLINEFTGNVDAGKYSTYIYKPLGDKFKLCVWDFNNACDNYQETEIKPRGFVEIWQAWFIMLMKDEEFVEQVLQRYEQLRQGVLSDEYLMNYIDDTLRFLGPAVERNNERWATQIAGWNALNPEGRNVHSHEEAVDQLKSWVHARGAWLDEYIHVLKQYGHPSRNKLYNH